MPSLLQILSDSAPLLLVDSASSRIQVGFFASAGEVRWEADEAEAGIGLFRCVERLGCELDAVRAFAFCDGPGSILGIRTTAMALRTWCTLRPRPVYAYRSLAVVARSLDNPATAVIADARRGHWHVYLQPGVLRRVAAENLPEATPSGCVMPEGFRHWAPLPPGTGSVPYDLAQIFSRPEVAGADLFTPTDDPDAFVHAEPDYATWTPDIHRAPAP